MKKKFSQMMAKFKKIKNVMEEKVQSPDLKLSPEEKMLMEGVRQQDIENNNEKKSVSIDEHI